MKASIVVPIYNAEQYIKKCIGSIQKQTYTNWELILVDDGSADRSGAICDAFAEKDNRIRVIHQENQGSITARRNGVMDASGKYICFCDADDRMPYDALETLMRAENLANEGAVIVGQMAKQWNHFIVPSRHLPPCFQIAKPRIYTREAFIDELYCSWFGISNVPVTLWGKLYPAKLLKDTFAKIPNIVKFMGDDLIMTLDLMPKAKQIVMIPDVVYQYRLGGGTSKFQPKLMEDWLALYRFKKEYAGKYPMPQPIGKLMDVELCNMTFTYFEMLEAHGKLTEDAIEAACNIAEVSAAANNAEINPNFAKARLLREKNPEAICALVKPTMKKRLWQMIKKICYKFA